jgi:hypothetical protein
MNAHMVLLASGHLATAAFVIACVGILCYALSLRFQRHLRTVPGPFLASFTDAWRLIQVNQGRFELVNQDLHGRYGDLVRVGPNCVSVGDPHEIKQIYGITRLFEKVSQEWHAPSIPAASSHQDRH